MTPTTQKTKPTVRPIRSDRSRSGYPKSPTIMMSVSQSTLAGKAKMIARDRLKPSKFGYNVEVWVTPDGRLNIAVKERTE